jgi:hypothetical protein
MGRSARSRDRSARSRDPSARSSVLPSPPVADKPAPPSSNLGGGIDLVERLLTFHMEAKKTADTCTRAHELRMAGIQKEQNKNIAANKDSEDSGKSVVDVMLKIMEMQQQQMHHQMPPQQQMYNQMHPQQQMMIQQQNQQQQQMQHQMQYPQHSNMWGGQLIAGGQQQLQLPWQQPPQLQQALMPPPQPPIAPQPPPMPPMYSTQQHQQQVVNAVKLEGNWGPQPWHGQ